jgi:hypothetical protein
MLIESKVRDDNYKTMGCNLRMIFVQVTNVFIIFKFLKVSNLFENGIFMKMFFNRPLHNSMMQLFVLGHKN